MASSDSSQSDRRIHARSPEGYEIVRYDRAGKWYVEGEGGLRFLIPLSEAVRLATLPGVLTQLGIPGGGRFDALVRKTGRR